MTALAPPLVVAALLEAALGTALFVAIRPHPPAAPIHGTALSVALGAAVGVCLLIVLAGRLPPRPRVRRTRLAAVAARAFVLAIGALAEELIWRVVALGVLVVKLGPWLALALSTAGFALSHAGQGRRPVVTHLATGSAFGAVFLTTASFAAAATAHVTYNLGALLAAESDPQEGPLGREQVA